MAGNLGPVKPWVADAAGFLGKEFGIKDIGGWRAKGSVPGSNHPKGLALDFMTRNGQALADYARANAAELGVTEVIWNRKIWGRRRDGALIRVRPTTPTMFIFRLPIRRHPGSSPAAAAESSPAFLILATSPTPRAGSPADYRTFPNR
jgi:hypothetical protein